MSKLNTANRLYDYSISAFYVRDEFPIIADWVPQGATVIDLGAANGSLLHFLREKKDVTGVGVESAESGVLYAKKHNLDVRLGSVDVGDAYAAFKDNEFDVAICNVTIQMVLFPEIVLSEMKRIARYQIISFPNFAYIGNRMDLLLRGRMPRPMLHGYSWYNTGHIHQLSVKDFRMVCAEFGLAVQDVAHLGSTRLLATKRSGNMFAKASVFLTESV